MSPQKDHRYYKKEGERIDQKSANLFYLGAVILFFAGVLIASASFALYSPILGIIPWLLLIAGTLIGIMANNASEAAGWAEDLARDLREIDEIK